MSKEIEQSYKDKKMHVHYIPSEKFKTILIGLKMKAPMNRDTVTQRAMLPYILRKGSEAYPTEAIIQEKLDDLYGATLSLSAGKSGSDHIIDVYVEIPNHEFIDNEESFLPEAFKIMSEVLFRPLVKDGSFDQAVVEREKTSIRQQLKAINDHHVSYANQRMIEEMYKGEPYGVNGQGYEEELDKITGEQLYEYYMQALKDDRMDVYLVGDFKEEDVHPIVEKSLHFNLVTGEEETDTNVSTTKQVKQEVSKVNEVIEHASVQQACLHIGFRTKMTGKDKEFSALQVFNGIFGGSPGSKLFLNIREEHGLAYYVASGTDSNEDLLMVYAGIASSDYEKTRNLIKEQLKEVQVGKFTEQMMTDAKSMLINHYRSMGDDADSLMEMYYSEVLNGYKRTPQESIALIEAVTKDQVMKVAKGIEEDTVFLLTDEEEV